MAIKHTKDSWKQAVLFLNISSFPKALHNTQRRAIWSRKSVYLSTTSVYQIDTWLLKLHSCTVRNQFQAKLQTLVLFFIKEAGKKREKVCSTREIRGNCCKKWHIHVTDRNGSDSRFCLFVVKYFFFVQCLVCVHKNLNWCLSVVSGWYEGERLRDGERGWFLAVCAELITCQATIEKNMQRMDRLQSLETNVWDITSSWGTRSTW